MAQPRPESRALFSPITYRDVDETATGLRIFANDMIPPDLRTQAYDELICSGGVVLPTYNAARFAQDYADRWQALERRQERIRAGELRVSTIIAQHVLRRTFRVSPGEEEARERQELMLDQLGHLVLAVADGNQSIAIATEEADYREAHSGSFMVVDYGEEPSIVTQTTRAGELVVARQDDLESQSFSITNTAFNNIWHDPHTFTTREDVSGIIMGISDQLQAEM